MLRSRATLASQQQIDPDVVVGGHRARQPQLPDSTNHVKVFPPGQFEHGHPTVGTVQHQQCPHCFSDLPDQDFQQKLILERVETKESWTTISSRSTASNIRGPGRTLGNLMSIAGRGLERAMVAIPEILNPPPDVVLHKKAEESLKEAKLKLSNQSRVLLLGSEESGKSEVIKQMRLIHKVPYTPSELETFRRLVYKQIIDGMLGILDAIEDKGIRISLDNEDNAELVQGAGDLRDGEPFPFALYDALSSLWSEEGAQNVWEERKVFGLSESLSYFFSSLDRLFHPAYMPTDQDILHLEIVGKGITETTFSLRDSEVVIIDPVRSMGDRRKWMHQFSDVTLILFVVNLSGYDECLAEDPDANQMQDAMMIWDSVCHSQWFQDTALILFLNKYDRFQEKIKTSNIKDHFPDYVGPPGDATAGVDYFKKRFARLAWKGGRSKERTIYFHITSSDDTAMLRRVMAAIEDTTLRQELHRRHLI